MVEDDNAGCCFCSTFLVSDPHFRSNYYGLSLLRLSPSSKSV
jgi:hypothetical protein